MYVHHDCCSGERGGLVTLREDGFVECSYMGTVPVLFAAGNALTASVAITPELQQQYDQELKELQNKIRDSATGTCVHSRLDSRDSYRDFFSRLVSPCGNHYFLRKVWRIRKLFTVSKNFSQYNMQLNNFLVYQNHFSICPDIERNRRRAVN